MERRRMARVLATVVTVVSVLSLSVGMGEAQSMTCDRG